LVDIQPEVLGGHSVQVRAESAWGVQFLKQKKKKNADPSTSAYKMRALSGTFAVSR
jgi:hypothetical protein